MGLKSSPISALVWSREEAVANCHCPDDQQSGKRRLLLEAHVASDRPKKKSVKIADFFLA
jgi:hypothetical protein